MVKIGSAVQQEECSLTQQLGRRDPLIIPIRRIPPTINTTRRTGRSMERKSESSFTLNFLDPCVIVCNIAVRVV